MITMIRTRSIFPMIVLCLLTTQYLSAQDCQSLFPFEKGTLMGFTHYDGKGKEQSTSEQKIVIIDDNGSEGLTAQVEVSTSDAKGKEAMSSTFKMICKDNIVYMDMSAAMPQLTEAFSSMEVTMSGESLQIPSRLSVGQVLPDARMEVQAASGGMNLIKMTIEITDRKVEGKETVTTPAGTFECYKIAQVANTKMLISKSFRSVTWYADQVGMVKSENYDKKGKVESSSVLTKFKKG